MNRMSGIFCVLAAGLFCSVAAAQLLQTPLPGSALPKYVDPLPTFVGARVDGTVPLTVAMEERQQAVLPASVYAPLPPPFNAGTYVWAYSIDNGSVTVGPLYPTYTIEARRGTPTRVTYINNLVNPVLQDYLVVDQTLHWADPLMQHHSMLPYTGPVPAVVHLHGGEVPSEFDGGPDAWFTPGLQYTGPAWQQGVTNVYTYPNTQEAATIWFHDHTLGATRLNVYAGMAGFYLLRDQRDDGDAGNSIGLPAGPREIELAIQDRMFDTNGQLLFPNLGVNPMVHPFWIPEFFGDVMVVNGKSWPFLNVEPRRYRFRVLNGCNARFLNMRLFDPVAGVPGPPIWQIGTDGGLLDAAVPIVSPRRLLLAPGERADIIVDFSGFAGRTLILDNNAKAPYPNGTPANPGTVGQIMQFRVGTAVTGGTDGTTPPASLVLRPAPGLVKLVNFNGAAPAAGVTVHKVRKLTLNEVMGMAGPLEVLVNNTKWDGALSPNAGGITERPTEGETERWEIINLTADAHPIHLHLTQFQLVSRQRLQTAKYLKAYGAAFPAATFEGVTYPGGVYIPAYGSPKPYDFYKTPAGGWYGGVPDFVPYLQGGVRPAEPNERGWKDTFVMYPGEVTTVLVRFAPTDLAVATPQADLLFPFNPGTGPGYVWHCHIVDHEDNEMMRPYAVNPNPSRTPPPAVRGTGEGRELPTVFALEQNYPNPFNPETEIRFSLPADIRVRLVVVNTLGAEVGTLLDGPLPAGYHTVRFDARGLASGMYLYRLTAGAFSAQRKMVILK